MATQHIILAEGRPNLQHSLGLMLKQADYRVSIANTTEDALTIAKAAHNNQETVDLLIADLDSASIETCRAFMHTLSVSGLAIPYLVLAEEICDQTAAALKMHGCITCITKPFEPKILLRSIEHALNQLLPKKEHHTGRTAEKNSTESAVNG